jgi:hypothetical protein
MYRRFPTSAECDIQTEQLAPNAKYPASGHHGRAHIGLQFLVSRDGFGNDRASFLDRLTAFRSADSRSSKTLPLFNERNWPMLFLTRCGLAIIRWLLNAGMLMLIILLLFMDTPDRRPFVQSLALGVVAVVESDWAKDFIPADPGADSIKEPSEPEPEQFEPWDPPEPSPSDRRDDRSEFSRIQLPHRYTQIWRVRLPGGAVRNVRHASA